MGGAQVAEKVLARCGRAAVRKFRRSDLAERLEWLPYKDPFNAHLNFPLATFMDRERWLWTRTVNAGRMYFAIVDEYARLVGEISLRDIEPVGKTSRLGIHLASNKLGEGYGREALEALLSYYFRNMKWEAMYLDVAAFNVRALTLYEHMHFEHIAPFWRQTTAPDVPVFTDEQYAPIRRFFRHNGNTVEVLHYDMLLSREVYLETHGAEKPCPPERKAVKT